jgi:hypothetical protein
MRALRIAFLATLGAASLAVPAVSAADTTLSIDPAGQLGPEGASAVVFVTLNCDPSITNPGVNVQLAQSQGNRLVQGFGQVGGFGGTPFVCEGTPQLLSVRVTPSFPIGVPPRPFKVGGAAATAFFNGSSPTGFVTMSVGPQEIRLKK